MVVIRSDKHVLDTALRELAVEGETRLRSTLLRFGNRLGIILISS